MKRNAPTGKSYFSSDSWRNTTGDTSPTMPANNGFSDKFTGQNKGNENLADVDALWAVPSDEEIHGPHENDKSQPKRTTGRGKTPWIRTRIIGLSSNIATAVDHLTTGTA